MGILSFFRLSSLQPPFFREIRGVLLKLNPSILFGQELFGKFSGFVPATADFSGYACSFINVAPYFLLG
nr:MAG TPA: hypothetical protein [Caudoviricetes sp.]